MGKAASRPEGPLATSSRAFPHFTEFVEVAEGFWNLKADFRVVGGTLNLGTHMSVCRLTAGAAPGAVESYVAIDTAPLSPRAEAELAELTRGGSLLTAVITTHPFHTLSIPAFHSRYPSSPSRRWFGCPRHLARMKIDDEGRSIQWHASLADICARRAFEPELAMEVPAGAEFADPKPPHRNHFSNVFVLHRASRTVHDDDCIICISPTGIGLARVLYPSFKPCSMHFHPSISTVGLYPTPEAPAQFKDWLTKLLENWDFVNLCTAHNGNCYGDAKERIRFLLASKDADLRKLAAKNAACVAEDRMKQAWDGADGPGSLGTVLPSQGYDCDCWGKEDEVECG